MSILIAKSLQHQVSTSSWWSPPQARSVPAQLRWKTKRAPPTPQHHLFLPNSKELKYLDQDGEQPEDALQQLPNSSINFSLSACWPPSCPHEPCWQQKLGSAGVWDIEWGTSCSHSQGLGTACHRDPSGATGEEVPDGFCLLPLKDSWVQDSWIAWEQELRWAQHEQDNHWCSWKWGCHPNLWWQKGWPRGAGLVWDMEGPVPELTDQIREGDHGGRRDWSKGVRGLGTCK